MAGVVDSHFLDSLNAQNRIEGYRKRLQNPSIASFVVEDILSQKIIAQADLGASRKEIPIEGEIYSIYILKEYQGVGIGRALFAECRRQLTSRDFKNFFVSVIMGNDRAIDFYRRMGGHLYGRDSVHLGDKRYITETYVWSLSRTGYSPS